jgi:hypothetical protein
MLALSRFQKKLDVLGFLEYIKIHTYHFFRIIHCNVDAHNTYAYSPL